MSEDDKDKINVVNDQSSDDNEKNQSESVNDQSKNNVCLCSLMLGMFLGILTTDIP